MGPMLLLILIELVLSFVTSIVVVWDVHIFNPVVFESIIQSSSLILQVIVFPNMLRCKIMLQISESFSFVLSESCRSAWTCEFVGIQKRRKFALLASRVTAVILANTSTVLKRLALKDISHCIAIID